MARHCPVCGSFMSKGTGVKYEEIWYCSTCNMEHPDRSTKREQYKEKEGSGWRGELKQ